MKPSMERSALLRAMSRAQSVVERRNTIPILSNVLIEADSDQVSFRATDLDIEVIDRAPAMVTRAGATTVPARHACTRSRGSCPTAPWSNSQTTASPAGSRFRPAGRTSACATLPREDFPIMASGRIPDELLVPGAALRPAVRQGEVRDLDRGDALLSQRRLYARGQGAGRPVLRCVATDGHRLARIDAPLPEGAEECAGRDRAAQDGGRTAQAARRRRDDDRGVGQRDQGAVRDAGRDADIQGDRRDVPGLCPGDPDRNTRRLEVDAAEFAQAVDRVATVQSERSPRGQAGARGRSADPVGQRPRLGRGRRGTRSSPMATSGWKSASTPSTCWRSPARWIRENAVFLFNTAGDPTLMREGNDEWAVYVVMPMRV